MNEIHFTQGDAVELIRYAQDETGGAVNIAGATFATSLVGKTSVASLDDSKHTILDAEKGEYKITLTGAESAAVEAGAGKDILTTITVADKATTYRSMGVLEVYGPASPQATQGATNIFLGAGLGC